MTSRRARIGWRRRLWRMLTRGVFALVAVDVVLAAIVAAGGGDESTNAHPAVRFGGGPYA